MQTDAYGTVVHQRLDPVFSGRKRLIQWCQTLNQHAIFLRLMAKGPCLEKLDVAQVRELLLMASQIVMQSIPWEVCECQGAIWNCPICQGRGWLSAAERKKRAPRSKDTVSSAQADG